MNLRDSHRGVAIYLAIIIMVVLLSIGLGISTLLVNQIKMIRGMGHSVVALYAADTGIERELYEDNLPPFGPYYGYLDLDGDGGGVPGDCGDLSDTDDACYEVTSIELPGGEWVLTDGYDYWEDQNPGPPTHSFVCVDTGAGGCIRGANFCDGGTDASLHVGGWVPLGSPSGSYSEVTVNVIEDTDEIKLRFQMPYHGGNGLYLYVDGVAPDPPYLAGNGCNFVEITFTSMSAYTGDGQVVIKIDDPGFGASADSEITYLEVLSWKKLKAIQSVGVYKGVQRAIEVNF